MNTLNIISKNYIVTFILSSIYDQDKLYKIMKEILITVDIHEDYRKKYLIMCGLSLYVNQAALKELHFSIKRGEGFHSRCLRDPMSLRMALMRFTFKDA